MAQRYIAFDVETPNAYNDRISAIGITVQDGRKCMPKENVDAAIEKITSKFSDCFCEVSPHTTFPVFTFKVSRAKRIFFEAIII